MTLSSRAIALWLGLASPFVAAPALAQAPAPSAVSLEEAGAPTPAPTPAPAQSSPDALEQPYGPSEAPPAAAAQDPTVPGQADADTRPGAVAHPDTRPPLPIRQRRRLALTGEVGWNGLAGFGPVLSYHAAPHVTFDFGAGLSLTGWKVGLRGRYNFLEGPVTPFLGAGVMATSGFGEISGIKDDTDPNADEVTLRVRPSQFAQAVVGVDYTRKNGFTMIGALGYAFLMNDNLVIVAGTPTRDEKQAFDVIFKSGLVLTLGTGYSF